MFETYRARRRFQYNSWVYAPAGPCECSQVQGSEVVSRRMAPGENKSVEGQFDLNPCQDSTVCSGLTATGCTCNDNGYCGLGGKGACGIKPYQYGGPIFIVREGDPRKEYILVRRFAVYDPTLMPGDEFAKTEIGKLLALGEPNPDKVLFSPQGEKIEIIKPVVSTPVPVKVST